MQTVEGEAEYDTAVFGPVGVSSLGAGKPSVTGVALYTNLLNAWSPLATAGNVRFTVSVLPALSAAFTVTDAVLASAVSGVPLITPVEALMLSPEGNPVALYPSMPDPPEGLIAVLSSSTFSDPGAVYVGAAGAVRSTASERVTVREV